jgi:ABC-type enterobactin transport system permease subunit
MAMQKNQRLVAIPNVLRDQTVPNRLRGMGRATEPFVTPSRRLPVGLIAVLVGIAVAMALALFGRAS